MLGFTRVAVFDPIATMLRAGAALPAVVGAAWLGGPVGGIFGVVAGSLWFAHLARLDRHRVGALSLLLDDVRVEAVDVDDDGIEAVVRVRAGSVARLGQRMQRHLARVVRPGTRRIPLLVVVGGWQITWFEHGRHVELTPEEARGAAAVVLTGDDVRIELLIGGYAGHPARPLAVSVASSHGSLQCWDPVVAPVLADTDGTAVPAADDLPG